MIISLKIGITLLIMATLAFGYGAVTAVTGEKKAGNNKKVKIMSKVIAVLLEASAVAFVVAGIIKVWTW